jgi:hypothetical protein
MPKMSEILCIVHGEALRHWASRNMNCSAKAREVDKNIEEASSRFDEVIHFEFDPWEPEWNKNPHFTYEDFAQDLIGASVTMAGVERSYCVNHVAGELYSQGVIVNIDLTLTMEG